MKIGLEQAIPWSIAMWSPDISFVPVPDAIADADVVEQAARLNMNAVVFLGRRGLGDPLLIELAEQKLLSMVFTQDVNPALAVRAIGSHVDALGAAVARGHVVLKQSGIEVIAWASRSAE